MPAAVLALSAAPGITATPAQAARAAGEWNPPAHLVQPLTEVGRHVESTYPDLYGFRNYGWDQIMADKGSVNAVHHRPGQHRRLGGEEPLHPPVTTPGARAARPATTTSHCG